MCWWVEKSCGEREKFKKVWGIIENGFMRNSYGIRYERVIMWRYILWIVGVDV